MRKESGKTARMFWGTVLGNTVRALAAGAVFAAAACGGAQKTGDISGDVIQLSDAFSSDFSLVDQNGKPVTSKDYKGKVMLIYFGYTHCPDVCPLSLGTISAALTELSDKQQAQIAPLFISVDPDRDTPKVMKAYLSFDDRLTGLTGTDDQIGVARKSFKVAARKEKLPNSALGYEVQHSSLFYIVDRAGTPVAAVRGSVSPDELTEILRRSLKGSLT